MNRKPAPSGGFPLSAANVRYWPKADIVFRFIWGFVRQETPFLAPEEIQLPMAGEIHCLSGKILHPPLEPDVQSPVPPTGLSLAC
jgi:hypothetical protein